MAAGEGFRAGHDSCIDPGRCVRRRARQRSGVEIPDLEAENLALRATAFSQLGLDVRPALVNGAAG
jgi:hypothetical protein